MRLFYAVAAAAAGMLLHGAESQAPYAAQATRILTQSRVQGGCVVHLGCGNGRLTAAFYANEAYLAHGLDRDPRQVEAARRYLYRRGLAGHVSVDRLQGRTLPYADNMVNLLVVEPHQGIPKEELMRVLAPGGTLCMRTESGFRYERKAWPKEYDQWTHCMHGPDNNAVSSDSAVGPPDRFQWISPPRFSRSHDHLATVSVAVTAGGRLFSIIDEGPIALAAARPKWRLVAQDAFNGIRLWSQPIEVWEYHLRDFRSGPPDLARRLVATPERVYVTLGYGKPLTALHAATGAVLKTYEGTAGTQEIILSDGTLFLITGKRNHSWRAKEAQQIVSQTGYRPDFEHYTPPVWKRIVLAVKEESGEILWHFRPRAGEEIMPCTLCVASGKVFLHTTEELLCLSARSGRVLWKAQRPVQRVRLAWSTPTVVAWGGLVFSADRRAEKTEGELLWIPSGGYHQYIRGEGAEGNLIAFSADTGTRLWSSPAYEGFNSPVDVLCAGGLLWTGRFAWGKDPGIVAARDPRTGKVVRTRPPDQSFMGRMGHARCHRIKATCRYLLMGRRGIEFVDLQTGVMHADRWVRGICQYGIVPANGLIYVPPHSCACSAYDLLKCGYLALASGPPRKEPQNETILLRGSAFSAPVRESTEEEKDAWPLYRCDPQRSGATAATVRVPLSMLWKTQLAPPLTGVVVAGGTLCVAEKDAAALHAFEAETGKKRWSYHAGGRIDSPPSIHAGRVLFGSADGYVTCLRLSDGKLIWRLRAAPEERRIVVYGQLESPWPVSGSVLIYRGAAYFVAGRTAYLNAGLFLYKVDPQSGRVLVRRRIFVDKKQRGTGKTAGGTLPDLFSAQGDSLFLRNVCFDCDLVRKKKTEPHVWSSVGFLDDSWWHRTYFQIGTSMGSGWGAWVRAGQRVPAGRLLVTDGRRAFGYGRNQYNIPGAHVGIDAETAWGPLGPRQGRFTFYRLFGKPLEKSETPWPGWSRRISVIARACVLAGETLFAAGPVDPLKKTPASPSDAELLAEALRRTQGGKLIALNAQSGQILQELALPSPPVFEGMAAAYGRLYLASKAGSVLCLGPRR